MTKEQVVQIATDARQDWDNVGIRFENKQRNAGDVITDCSRHNADRSDERDFPVFGSDEYNQMQELDGVCAYAVNSYAGKREIDGIGGYHYAVHCYLLGSDDAYTPDDGDDGEIVMRAATVLAIVF